MAATNWVGKDGQWTVVAKRKVKGVLGKGAGQVW